MRPFDNLNEFDETVKLGTTDPEALDQRLRLIRPGGGSETQVRVYYGPPGTGKTLAAVVEAVKLADPDFTSGDPDEAFRRLTDLREQVAFVTFHQSLQYEDMVEAIRPVVVPPDAMAEAGAGEGGSGDEATEVGDEAGQPPAKTGGELEYRRWEGPLLRLIRNAQADAAREYVVVIDEINRGDVSRILGPLISSIEPDKRLGSSYPIGFEALYPIDPSLESRIFMPSNLHIIGTMNSADRNIALVDYALRRRFEFVPLPPDSSILAAGGGELDPVRLLDTLNRRIAFLLDADHRIGHGYFMSCTDDADIVRVLATKVVPLLHEYFYGNEAEILLVLGEREAGEYTIHDVIREEADFESLFGISAAEATVLGYRASARRMSLEISMRFWDPRQPPGRPGDLEYAIRAVKAIYEAGDAAVVAAEPAQDDTQAAPSGIQDDDEQVEEAGAEPAPPLPEEPGP